MLQKVAYHHDKYFGKFSTSFYSTKRDLGVQLLLSFELWVFSENLLWRSSVIGLEKSIKFTKSFYNCLSLRNELELISLSIVA